MPRLWRDCHEEEPGGLDAAGFGASSVRARPSSEARTVPMNPRAEARNPRWLRADGSSGLGRRGAALPELSQSRRGRLQRAQRHPRAPAGWRPWRRRPRLLAAPVVEVTTAAARMLAASLIAVDDELMALHNARYVHPEGVGPDGCWVFVSLTCRRRGEPAPDRRRGKHVRPKRPCRGQSACIGAGAS